MTKLDVGVAQCRPSDESQFCVQYSYGHIRVWKLRGDRSSPAHNRYRHRGLALVMFGQPLVTVPHLQDLSNRIFQQDNVKLHAAPRDLTIIDTQGIRLLL
ncbi:hypothetical protein TNCV_522821 [Trichonephila clavipes]|nr:hypothetical protein TNCV_522821 [Trichonephila clavipes]